MPRYVFNGTARVKIIEAEGLKATDYSTRIFSTPASQLSPYINIDVDDVPVCRTTTRARTQNPQYNEEFQLSIHSGGVLNLTVFHDSALPPDEFVAMCSVDLLECQEPSWRDSAANPGVWLDLEPNGRLRVNTRTPFVNIPRPLLNNCVCSFLLLL